MPLAAGVGPLPATSTFTGALPDPNSIQRQKEPSVKRMAMSIPVLVAAATVAVVATPTAAAAAVPNKETVSNSSVGDSDPDGNGTVVSVECPDDKWVYGSGVDVSGSGRAFVIVDELVPSLNSVYAYAHEFEDATSLTWTLRVWAVCGDPAGTHRTVYQESDFNSFNKSISVSCPDGTVVTGTGWKLDGGPGQILVDAVVPTENEVTVSGYEVDEGGGYSLPWLVRAYATCVTDPGGYLLLSSNSTSTSAAKPGDAGCLYNTESLGGGFDVIDGLRGRINMINMIPTTPAVLTYAHEVVQTTNSWSIRTYAICANG